MTLPEYFQVKKNTQIDGRYPAVRQHIDRDVCFIPQIITKFNQNLVALPVGMPQHFAIAAPYH